MSNQWKITNNYKEMNRSRCAWLISSLCWWCEGEDEKYDRIENDYCQLGHLWSFNILDDRRFVFWYFSFDVISLDVCFSNFFRRFSFDIFFFWSFYSKSVQIVLPEFKRISSFTSSSALLFWFSVTEVKTDCTQIFSLPRFTLSIERNY
jgi:hypothetical protein